MEANPLVSVVTPCYNAARFLEETIRSVLEQDYPLIEYIVMDGGSTDGTLEILHRYESKLRYQSQPDAGQADAINRGFHLSSGRIFAYLNADDTYLPGAVSVAVRQMLAHPEAAVVYGEAYHVREHGQVIGRYPTHAFAPQLFNRCCYICQPAAFVRREVFEEVGMMDPNLHCALDYDLWIRIAKRYSMLKIDDYLATSRMYPGNKTLGRRRQMYKEVLDAVRGHYGYVPYDWVYGYSSWLVDGKNQLFEPAQPSLRKIGLSLLLGSYYNRNSLRRYWREWSAGVRGKEV